MEELLKVLDAILVEAEVEDSVEDLVEAEVEERARPEVDDRRAPSPVGAFLAGPVLFCFKDYFNISSIPKVAVN